MWQVKGANVRAMQLKEVTQNSPPTRYTMTDESLRKLFTDTPFSAHYTGDKADEKNLLWVYETLRPVLWKAYETILSSEPAKREFIRHALRAYIAAVSALHGELLIPIDALENNPKALDKVVRSMVDQAGEARVQARIDRAKKQEAPSGS